MNGRARDGNGHCRESHHGHDFEIQAEPVEHVRVEPGVRLAVRFPYRIDEVSKDQETWTLAVTTRIQGQPDRVSQRQHEDCFMLTDSVGSFVEEVWEFDQPGSRVIEFEAAANVSSVVG